MTQKQDPMRRPLEPRTSGHPTYGTCCGKPDDSQTKVGHCSIGYSSAENNSSGFGESNRKLQTPRLSSVSSNLKPSGGDHMAAGRMSVSSRSRRIMVIERNYDWDDDRTDVKKPLLFRAADVIPCLGIMMALGASLFLGSAGMLVKMIHSVNGVQVAVFRALFQLVFYGLMLVVSRTRPLPARGELGAVLGRAIPGAISITCSYYALKLIPLGDATAIRFSLPIWTLIIGYLLLGESCSFIKIISVVISVSGVLLIARPQDFELLSHRLLGVTTNLQLIVWGGSETQVSINDTGNSSLSSKQDIKQQANLYSDPLRQFEGCLLALLSSICLSFSIIALRKCKQTPAHVIIVWLSAFSVASGCAFLFVCDAWRSPSGSLDWMLIFLNGLFGSIGQWLITNAAKVEQSGVISLARTCDVQVAFIYSAFLLHEQITLSSLIGSAMVSMSVIFVVIPKLTCTTVEIEDEDLDLEGNTEQPEVGNASKNEHQIETKLRKNLPTQEQPPPAPVQR